jgi:hypothetical protein
VEISSIPQQMIKDISWHGTLEAINPLCEITESWTQETADFGEEWLPFVPYRDQAGKGPGILMGLYAMAG